MLWNIIKYCFNQNEMICSEMFKILLLSTRLHITRITHSKDSIYISYLSHTNWSNSNGAQDLIRNNPSPWKIKVYQNYRHSYSTKSHSSYSAKHGWVKADNMRYWYPAAIVIDGKSWVGICKRVEALSCFQNNSYCIKRKG